MLALDRFATYIGPMTTNQGAGAKISEGIRERLQDHSQGRRSIRWLAGQVDIPYSTLQRRLRDRPGRLTTDELFRIADALGTDVPALLRDGAK